MLLLKELDSEKRHRMERQLDSMTTELLRQWFPEADLSDKANYYQAMEWKTEDDVMEALIDYLVERGLAEVNYS